MNNKTDLQHIAIIMAGTERWTPQNASDISLADDNSIEALREAIGVAIHRGIKYLTVQYLEREYLSDAQSCGDSGSGMLHHFICENTQYLSDLGIRVQFIGNFENIPAHVSSTFNAYQDMTKNNTNMLLTVAINYSARQELTSAAYYLAKKVYTGAIEPTAITENLISQFLSTHQLPDPDLLICTGGIKGFYNFLLWQCAYTELVFTPVLWPDFNQKTMEDSIKKYHSRDRRFGALQKKQL